MFAKWRSGWWEEEGKKESRKKGKEKRDPKGGGWKLCLPPHPLYHLGELVNP